MEERTPGRRSFLLPGPTFSGFLKPGKVGFSFSYKLKTDARNGPPPGWAGWGRRFVQTGQGRLTCHVQRLPLGGKLSPKVTDEGAIPPKPFLVESHCPTACRLCAGFLLLRWVPGRPLIRPGCAGPPSPQGEGFRRGTQKSSLKKSQKRKSPNQGTYMGCDKTRNRFAASPNPKDGASPSERFYVWGCRGFPPATLCVRAFS